MAISTFRTKRSRPIRLIGEPEKNLPKRRIVERRQVREPRGR